MAIRTGPGATAAAAGGVATAPALLLLLLLTTLSSVAAVCPNVFFGTGVSALATDYDNNDGLFHPDLSNTLPLVGRCDVTGAGASTDPANWRAQLYLCGTADCSDGPGGTLPSGYQAAFPTCSNFTTQQSCTLQPTAVTYIASRYSSSYLFYLPSAYRGANTFYAVRCFFLCDASDAVTAEQRSSASFTVVSLVLQQVAVPLAVVESVEVTVLSWSQGGLLWGHESRLHEFFYQDPKHGIRLGSKAARASLVSVRHAAAAAEACRRCRVAAVRSTRTLCAPFFPSLCPSMPRFAPICLSISLHLPPKDYCSCLASPSPN